MESTPFAEGNSSKMYRASYAGQTVAAKVQHIDHSNLKMIHRQLDRFERQLVVVCKFHHPNICRVWGACTDSPGVLVLVMEYAQVSNICQSSY
jgi:hypothetical protein